ncbi:hypothetical protein [Catalinimonas alkaloidigena]|uniref:hypothetical protein n=1 Tax=Catalinimonas alkaloidigena TaxID=1075417 RepID=UPI000B7FA748|nr:hypothetical protein [Catalinimonas alkaloidigena]
MENETILLDHAIDDERLKVAYSRILHIKLDKIFIVSDLAEYFDREEKTDDETVVIQKFLFKRGDFTFELIPWICPMTRTYDFDQNHKFYKELAKELKCSILIPGDYKDLSDSYEIIITDGKDDREIIADHPDEYGIKGIKER